MILINIYFALGFKLKYLNFKVTIFIKDVNGVFHCCGMTNNAAVTIGTARKRQMSGDKL